MQIRESYRKALQDLSVQIKQNCPESEPQAWAEFVGVHTSNYMTEDENFAWAYKAIQEQPEDPSQLGSYWLERLTLTFSPDLFEIRNCFLRNDFDPFDFGI